MKPSFVTDHLDIWTSTIEKKSSSGRGSKGKISLYGIKKLRELILELAVRGKLVPQDPNDEPASVLLEKIDTEKERLIEEKTIKKPKKLPEISDEDKPFDLPVGWQLLRLGDAINVLNGRAYKKHEMLSEGTPLLRVGNLFTVNKWYYSDLELEPDKYINNGDLIYAWSASFGPFIWNGGKVIYHYHIWKLDLFDGKSLFKYYVLNYLASITEKIKSSGSGIAMIHMTKDRMEKLVLPIPPIEEQHRIVAKVDELMSLCDQLERQTEDSIAAHQTLVETLLDTLTQSQNAEELAQNWNRISDHFNTLFTTEHSIDQLKQTILQLAVMGKLVSQDPNDESASVLLEKIAVDKEKLIKEGKIKKQKPLPEINDDENPFDLPKGWEWCRFDCIIDQRSPLSYGVLVPGPDVRGGVPFARIGDLSINNPPVNPEKSISKEIDAKYERTRIYGGEILMAVVGSIGKLGIAPDSWSGANIARAICRIAPMKSIHSNYILLLLQSRFMQKGFLGDTRTLAQPTLNIGLIKNTLTPIPPLAEQLRIVNKVDQLITLCDEIGIDFVKTQTMQLLLTDVIVGQSTEYKSA